MGLSSFVSPLRQQRPLHHKTTARYSRALGTRLISLWLWCWLNSTRAVAHEHHADKIPEGQVISVEPIDTILWIHIAMQILTFGIIFPTGMVLGIVRSRWHVPTQTVGSLLAVTAYYLGHAHKGRQFAPNIHAAAAGGVMALLGAQVVLGVYLKLHLQRGVHARARPYVVMAHGVVGKTMPLASWTQMLFGGITALGFCHADHLGQCLAHFIMGSAFIGYAVLLTLVLLVGQRWLQRTRRSPEFFDSAVIAAWGVVNTFTEHRWGQAWVGNDLQHTTMGIVWWCAGLVGLWLSRTADGRPTRNVVPGVVILLTGYAMSSHAQHLMLSTMVHTVFGYTLMGAGLARIIEISFVLRDRPGVSQDGTAPPNSFQYLPIFLLYASGFLFMGATEEQMKLVASAGVSHVSYILVQYSFAFLFFFVVLVLIHIYIVHTRDLTPVTVSASASTRPLGHRRLGRNRRHRHRRHHESHRRNFTPQSDSSTFGSEGDNDAEDNVDGGYGHDDSDEGHGARRQRRAGDAAGADGGKLGAPPPPRISSSSSKGRRGRGDGDTRAGGGVARGASASAGGPRRVTVADAEEFELEGLIVSDGDDDDDTRQ